MNSRLSLFPTVQLISPSLFNNPDLSDVTIKQINAGKVREYYAHKAILSADSNYFLKAFTGSFKVSQGRMIPHKKTVH
jgi:hypothetical protein